MWMPEAVSGSGDELHGRARAGNWEGVRRLKASRETRGGRARGR
eukprot:CAMPEP_0206039752 /NCGR_PEP_ID=MMETSP1466-20131121/4958_1 /ASSEMBLY_ACC=CAM_ASM_001126 /TAXON_ID=44452 /ORGANISM="Pavlova gyrans, Strain CCMP608" /LENGTH=43 /DNA_ID= /DNA_START= /DNA_END= /DNA_ORIENTATION=